MGGDLTYRNIGNNKVELTFVAYKDARTGAGITGTLPSNITYRVYEASWVAQKVYTHYQEYITTWSKFTDVQPELPKCADSVKQPVQRGIYKDTILLNIDTIGYHVVWFANERNTSLIKNLDPGKCPFAKNPFGMVWYTYIPTKSIVNSSPQFLSSPIPYLCPGTKAQINPIVSDPDKDSLVFSLEIPYSPPADCSAFGTPYPTPYPPGHSSFTNVVYKTGFSSLYPFGTSASAISIDANTGEITVNPPSTATGAYVITLQVKEYRVDPVTHKATYVGQIRRDLQFVVGPCPSSAFGSAGIPQVQKDPDGYTRFVNPGDTLKFNVNGGDIDPADTMFIRASSGIFSNTPNIKPPYATFTNDTAVKKVTGKFFWIPTCEHITYSTPYTVTVVLSDINCHTVTKTYSIYVRSRPILKPPLITCADIVSSNKITLNWKDTLNTDSVMKKVFIYHKIYRRKGLSGKFTLIDSLTNYKTLTYTDNGVSGADTIPYSYFITTQNSCGLEGLGSDTISTIIPKVTMLSAKQAMVSWNKSYSKPGIYYKVLVDYGSGYSLVDSTKNLNYGFTGCKNTFSVQIKLDDGKYCSMFSGKTGKITIKDLDAPDAKKILNASVISHSKAVVEFAASDSTDVSQYYIYRAADDGKLTKIDSVKAVSGQATYVYFDNNVSTDLHKYCYSISAQDKCGNEGPKTSKHCLIYLQGNSGQIRNELKWNKYQGYSPDTVEVQIWEVFHWRTLKFINLADTLFNDTNAICRSVTYYRLSYKSSTDNYVTFSDSVRVISMDTVHPSEVNTISANVISGSQIDISFNKVPDRDVKSYAIEYRKGTKGLFKWITTVQPTQWPYVYHHTGINTTADTFYYQVYAEDTCGNNTSLTRKIHAAIQLNGLAKNKANSLDWSGYIGFNVSEYVIQKWKGSQWIDYVSTHNNKQYTDTGLGCNVTQYYRIKVLESGGNLTTAFSDSIALTPYDTVKPGKTMLRYVSIPGTNQVYIQWAKSTAKDVKKYEISRKGASELAYTAIDTVWTDTFYTDKTALTAKESYSYRVRAIDSCAENAGAYSDDHQTLFIAGSTHGCEQKIYLTWNAYIHWKAGVKKYELYRAVDNGSEILYATLNGSTLKFTDSNVNFRHTYTYSVQAWSNEGIPLVSASNKMKDSTYAPPKPYVEFASKITTDGTTGSVKIKWKSLKNIPYVRYARLYYKASGSSTFVMLKDSIPPSQDSFIHTGINTNTENHEYYILTTDSCGNVGDTSDVHKTTELKMTIGQLVHDLQWTAYKGWPVKSYIIQYLTGNTFENVDTVSANTFSLHRFPMPCNFNVSYRVAAISDKGDIAYSDTASGQAIDTVPANKPIVNNITVTGINKTILTFEGSDSADVYGYSIMRRDEGRPYQSVKFIPYGGPKVRYSFTDSVSTTSQQHCYVVITLDSCLNATHSDTFCPIWLSGQARNQEAIVQWTSFKGYDVKQYELQQYSNGSWNTLIYSNPGDTVFLHKPLSCYVPQYYRVAAYENGGSRISYSDSIQIVPFDTITPPAPSLRYVSAVPGIGMQLAWNWDKKSDVKYFEIWRSVNGGGFNKVTTVLYDSMYLDKTAIPVNNRYAYYITAIDSCNSTHISQPSDTDVSIQLRLSTVACTPLIRINWTTYTDLPGGTDQYAIYRSENGNPPVLLTTTNATTTHYNDSAVREGSIYTYLIQALDNESSYFSQSDTASLSPFVVHPPKGVKILRATVQRTGKTNGENLIEWQKADLTDSFLAGYRVYRADTANGSFNLIADIKNLQITSYTHSGVNTEDSQSYYFVTPYNICQDNSMEADTHKVIRLQVTNQMLQARLNWTLYEGFDVDHYQIMRSFDGSPMTSYRSTSAATDQYLDTNIFCGHQYVYMIMAVERAGNVQISLSDSVSITGQDTNAPATARLFAASVLKTSPTNGEVELSFLGATEKNRAGVIVYRKSGSGVYMPVDTFRDLKTIPLVYIDRHSPTSLMPTSYYLQSWDSCGNLAAPSDTQTVVWLKATAKDGRNVLRWTPYYGFGDSITYQVERKKDTATRWLVIDRVGHAIDSVEDRDVHCFVKYSYRIVVIKPGSLLSSVSNIDTAIGLEHVSPEAPVIVKASVLKTDTSAGIIQIHWLHSISPDVVQYVVYRSDNGILWKQLGILPANDTLFHDGGIPTYRKNYYYKVDALDSCGNISVDKPALHHHTLALRAAPGEQAALLSWNAYEGFAVQKYEIYKSGKLIATIPGNQVSYHDTPVSCIRSLIYSVRAIGTDTAMMAWSGLDSTRPYDHVAPQGIYMVSASVHDPNSSVRLTWIRGNSFDVAGYKIYRQLEGSLIVKEIYSTKDKLDTTYIDHIELQGTRPYWYMVAAFDSCGNTGITGNIGLTIMLQANAQPLEHTLNWNAYHEWQDGVDHYSIFRNMDSTGWFQIGSTNANELMYVDKDIPDTNFESFCYRVQAVEKTGRHNAASFSTIICLSQQPIVYIPNAFTPGISLGINDQFGPKGTYFRQYEMYVYNRWGEMVYGTDQSKPWDGRSKGSLVVSGVYRYMIKIKGYDGTPHLFKGNLTVLY
jgi:hypothetical protein